MTKALVVLAGLLLCGLALWMALAASRARGRAESRAEQAERDAETAARQGEIIAEHREPKDAIDRLRSGGF